MTRLVNVHLRLTERVHTRACLLAAKDGVTLEQFVRRAVQAALTPRAGEEVPAEARRKARRKSRKGVVPNRLRAPLPAQPLSPSAAAQQTFQREMGKNAPAKPPRDGGKALARLEREVAAGRADIAPSWTVDGCRTGLVVRKGKPVRKGK